MKRKKLIKQKKEELNKIDVQIIDIMAEVMKTAIDPNSNPFTKAIILLTASNTLKHLQFQRTMIASQPIPPKFKSGGVHELSKIKDIIVSKEETERILNQVKPVCVIDKPKVYSCCKTKDCQPIYDLCDKRNAEISKKLDKIIKAVKTKKE